VRQRKLPEGTILAANTSTGNRQDVLGIGQRCGVVPGTPQQPQSIEPADESVLIKRESGKNYWLQRGRRAERSDAAGRLRQNETSKYAAFHGVAREPTRPTN